MNLLSKKLLSWGVGGVIAVSAGYVVVPWEGMSNQAYKDIVGVTTVCFGETKDVKMGDYRTTEQCEKGLAKELTEYNKNMRKHVTVKLLPYEEVAYTSFVWNLGETNFKNSTLLKKLNAGDRAGACAELLRWNKAGGRVVKGLDNRRKFEYEVCMGKNTEVIRALQTINTGEKPSITLEKESEGVDMDVLEIEDTASYSPAIEVPTVPELGVCRWKFFNICLKRE